MKNAIKNFLPHILFAILSCLFFLSVCYAKDPVDEQIEKQAIELLTVEKDIPHKQISITTNEGIVNVSGKVDTRLQENKIIELISSIGRVKDVKTDKLHISCSKEFLSDAYITAKAKGKLKFLAISKQITADYILHMETTNGVVHIFGEVIDKKDIPIIKNSIRNIIDVKGVKVNIKYLRDK